MSDQSDFEDFEEAEEQQKEKVQKEEQQKSVLLRKNDFLKNFQPQISEKQIDMPNKCNLWKEFIGLEKVQVLIKEMN